VTRTVTVLIDAENVRRSEWPNVPADELVERCSAWAEENGVRVVVVFDGRAPAWDETPSCVVVGTRRESADDRLASEAAELERAGDPYWLVTSDRGLRARAEAGADRAIGGGSFVRMLSPRGQIRRMP
jgi:hypothetical protein